jgi:hypothetical protein
MFAELSRKLATLFAPAEVPACVAYLRVPIEREDPHWRMRPLDESSYSFRLHSNVVPRDWGI